jgi:hypothetical protein
MNENVVVIKIKEKYWMIPDNKSNTQLNEFDCRIRQEIIRYDLECPVVIYVDQ